MSVSLGTVIFVAVKPIIKIYLILFVGWLLVRYNMLSMETSRGVSNIVVNAILPCLTFNKIVSNLSGSQIKEIGVVVLTAIVMFSFGGVMAYVASLVTPVPKKWKYGLIFGGTFGNISDLPMAYIQSMGTGLIFTSTEADKGIALSCIFLAIQSFLMMNVGMFQLVGLDFRDDDETTKNKKEEDDLTANNTNVNLINENLKEKEEKIDGNQANSEFKVVPFRVPSSTSSSDHLEPAITLHNRRTSNISSFNRVKSHESTYSTRSHNQKHQNLQSLIDEYSEADLLRTTTLDKLARTISITQEVGLKHSEENDNDDVLSFCSENEPDSKYPRWNIFIKRYKLGWLEYVLINLMRVPSISLLIALTVAMVPWLRCLFVKNSISIREAPDNLPVLNFVMDFTSYVGNAGVPMALILLGGTIARLEITEIPKGFWKTLLFMIPTRLVIMPIIGILWTNKLYSIGWIDDNISRFILMITWAVPSATAQVYFTAFYTPLEGDHIQMDCLAVYLLAQYPVLIVTLAIVVSYVLKVSLGV